MIKNDGRKLSHGTLETIRQLAVQRVEAGEPASAVMRSFGFCRTTIYRWLRKADTKGHDSLKAVKAAGRPPVLTPKQKEEIASWITGKDPRQYGFDFGLWTRQIIAQLVERRFHISLSVTTIGRVLAELGITPQKPVRRAYERDPEAVEQWMKEIFPGIRSRAKKRKADLFFLDEAGVRSDCVLGRSWAPKGKTPAVGTTGKRQSINAISAISPTGGFWFDVYAGRLTGDRFVEFLKDFLKGRTKPVLLIVDNHPTHRAKVVSTFVQSLGGSLEIFFLPGYSPDLNPDEFVWQHLKTNGIRKKPLQQNESLLERIRNDLQAIQKNIPLIRSFFRAPSVAYVLHS